MGERTVVQEDRALSRVALAAPAWARVGTTAPTENVRHAAAQELALQIGKVCGLDPIAHDRANYGCSRDMAFSAAQPNAAGHGTSGAVICSR